MAAIEMSATGSRGSHAERRRSTRARAFAAAIECLHEAGYAGASMVAVTRRAGLSRGALAKQFLTKADLYAALVEQLLDEMREDTLAYVRTFPPGLPRAMARIDYLWTLYKEPRAFAFLEVMLGSRADPELSERLEKVGESRNLVEKQLLSLEFDDMGIVDRRAAGLAGIQMLATVRGLALERLLNKNDDLLDAAFARQRRQLEDSYRALMSD
ncbi:TetR/AcrR family transcriptional regulator [Sphingopyxis sp.]|uniref:TetR/AcrR family transcriptional regulator n=1 Tax=Sphingopyxis sp. TaxID=1908224 RepID=UPI002DF0E99B|nr:TetR/AcrR family transcriptional regulator [Sphingopyxis sp.]